MLRLKVRLLAAGASVLATAGLAAGFGLAVGGSALASGGGGSAPPWYTEFSADQNPLGGITFYNAQGQVVTGGDITANGLGAYAVADTPDPLAPHTLATLYIYTPTSANPLTWSGGQFSDRATTYPDTTAPGPLATTTNPVAANDGSDESVQTAIISFPNTDTATGYAGLYDVRLRVSGGTGGDTSEFWDAVISVDITGGTATDPTAGTWSLDYPDYTDNTTTTLTATPSSEATSAPITLNADVSPATAGTVSFWTGYGTASPTQVGATQTVTSSSGSASVTATPPNGTTGYTAVFTPAVPDGAFSTATDTIPSYDIGSTGSLSYLVGSGPVSTTTTLQASPATSAQQKSSVTLTADVTASDSSSPAGEVDFKDNGTVVGTDAVSGGVATLNTSALPPSAPSGASLTATFEPTDPTSYSTSTSTPLSYTVNPVAVKPTISGKHQAGQKETCSESGVDSGVTVSYTWLANSKSIGTGASLVVPGSAYNKSLACKASVHDGSGPVSSSTSSSVKVSRGAALKATKRPTLSGSHKVGKTERVKTGTWSEKATFTYQWLLNGKAIKHATKSTFKPTRGDKGKKLSCRVTAHAAGFANGSATTSSVKISS